MSKTKSKWITFGDSVACRREDLTYVVFEEGNTTFKFGFSNQYTEMLNQRDVGQEEFDNIKKDYYKYKGEIKHE